MNIFSEKNRRRISRVIIAIIVLAMVVTIFAQMSI